MTQIGTDQQLMPIIDPKAEVAKAYTDPSKVNDETGYEVNDKGVTGDDSKSKGEKAAEAVGLAGDVSTAALATAKIAAKDAVEAAKALSQSGTVIGAIAAILPAVVNIISNFAEGKSQKVGDYIGIGVGVVGILSEYTGLGELYDGYVGAAIGIGSVGYDIGNIIFK